MIRGTLLIVCLPIHIIRLMLTNSVTEEEQAKIAPMIQAFQQFVGPSFRGPRPVEDAVQDILAVIEKSSVENGDGGTFVSHKGDTEHWVS